MPLYEQAALWRAAARGHEANGDPVKALECWNTARLILGLPPRKPRRSATGRKRSGSPPDT